MSIPVQQLGIKKENLKKEKKDVIMSLLFIRIQIWSLVSQSEICLVALDHFRWQNVMFMFLIQISLGFYMKSNKCVTNKRKFKLKLNVFEMESWFRLMNQNMMNKNDEQKQKEDSSCPTIVQGLCFNFFLKKKGFQYILIVFMHILVTWIIFFKK